MLGIHTAYTPIKRKVVGHIHNMMQFESITMILSALFWKKLQGPIKLYCDKDFYDYIKLLGLDDLWDEIDTKELSKLNSNVNHNTFWAYSKMYVNSLQTEPFVSLDIDLFQSLPYDYSTHDFVFSHIEKIDPNYDSISNQTNPVYYPNYHKLDLFKDRFKSIQDIVITNEAMNVAVLAVNKPEVYKEFIKYANSFIENNWFDPQDVSTHGFERIVMTYHSSSMITFVEQRLLHSFVNSKGFTKKPIFNEEYDASAQRWIAEPTNNPGITHLWGWKSLYRQPENINDRLALTDTLVNILKTMFYESYIKYIENGKVLKLCKL